MKVISWFHELPRVEDAKGKTSSYTFGVTEYTEVKL